MPSTPASSAAPHGAVELFTLLRDGVPRSRAELAAATGLSRATIGGRVDSLLAAGLIAPTGMPESAGGRPSFRFGINPEAGVVGAIDVGATHLAVGLLDLTARLISSTTRAVHLAENPGETLTMAAALLRDLLLENHIASHRLLAIGIGLPGPVDSRTGRPVNPPIMPGWNGVDVSALMREHHDVPVLVDNDVTLMALGERSAAWPEVDDMIVVKIATGIGSGLILGGRVHRGARGIAGDIGHAPLAAAESVRCRCGNLDCLEAHAGWPAIIRQLGRADITTGEHVIDLVQSGDSDAIRHIRQAGREIGEVLTTVVQLVNPSVIVLAGSMTAAGEHVLAGVREAVYQRSAPLATDELQIVASTLGDQVALLGGGILALDEALSADRVAAMLA